MVMQGTSLQTESPSSRVSPMQGVTGTYVELDGESYYEIRNSQEMPEFFMSIVGADDHWMFVSSRGALTAGRRNPDGAIFPYAADDQISAMRSQAGPVTVVSVVGTNQVWQPFADQAASCGRQEQSVYKSPMGNKVVFEERNTALGLVFRYRWTFSPRYGFVRDCVLTNTGSSSQSLDLLDGLQNILPCGVGQEFWLRYSNLGNAYKKSELLESSRLGIYYLSSIPTDRAEPSEGLRSTVVWHDGFIPDAILLSPAQLQEACCGGKILTETSVRGKTAAFLTSKRIELAEGSSIRWRQVADLNKDQTDVVNHAAWLMSGADTWTTVDEDIAKGESALKRLIASSDGLQCGANLNRVNRHFSNTLFNVMRGGVPLDNYQVESRDFRKHVRVFNKDVSSRHAQLLSELPDTISHEELNDRLGTSGDPDLIRLGLEYLPLAFSRRHGDPTRPWNRFSIDLKSDDGGSNLNYQGNWRDIFQNWEALGMAYPDFLPAMICRFVNATTADGYNAYRITKDGLEWEEPEPDDPWSNIGYWCDHQIIYLLKLLEWNRQFHPASSREQLSEQVFVHAEVPYRIKGFEDIKADPQETIDYDWDLSHRIEGRVEATGSDGKLLLDQSGQIHRVILLEKLLTLSLAKLSNLVPDGGIWLNTQRPEWNDANNALVGNGLSMVTTSYLHRWFDFLADWIREDEADSYAISSEVAAMLGEIHDVMTSFGAQVENGFSTQDRAAIVESLSRAGEAFRKGLYSSGPSGNTDSVERAALIDFIEKSRALMAATIRSNRRSDGLYHSYNLLRWTSDGLEVDTLYEMLEGQVAVLSSGLLSGDEAVELLDALRSSALYRADQDSYILYPNRELPAFLQKNQLTMKQVSAYPLLTALLEKGNTRIIKRDVEGGFHFNGDFRNASELKAALSSLDSGYEALVRQDRDGIAKLFEEVFDHRTFTGRSGTFFAYEGLGSIYWHMVSKLGLAVAENLEKVISGNGSSDTLSSLQQHLAAIRDGIGAEKSPDRYGAFPTDPYSHTPENAGVKQPGMTGQVKEDVLARYMELGVDIEDGTLAFNLHGFDREECVSTTTPFEYFNLGGKPATVEVPAGGFGFTVCQVPVVYRPGDRDEIRLHAPDGSIRSLDGHRLDQESSRDIFGRTGSISAVECCWTALAD